MHVRKQQVWYWNSSRPGAPGKSAPIQKIARKVDFSGPRLSQSTQFAHFRGNSWFQNKFLNPRFCGADLTRQILGKLMTNFSRIVTAKFPTNFSALFFRVSGSPPPPKNSRPKFTPSIVSIPLQFRFLEPKILSRRFSSYGGDQRMRTFFFFRRPPHPWKGIFGGGGVYMLWPLNFYFGPSSSSNTPEEEHAIKEHKNSEAGGSEDWKDIASHRDACFLVCGILEHQSEKTKGQQLKGKIVSALFRTPGFYYCLSSKRQKTRPKEKK